MINVQQFVAAMCESVESMKLTPAKKEFAKAVIRAAINYANSNSAPLSRAAHNSGEGLPNGNTANGGADPTEDQMHDAIAAAFAREGLTYSSVRRAAKAVLALSSQERESPE